MPVHKLGWVLHAKEIKKLYIICEMNVKKQKSSNWRELKSVLVTLLSLQTYWVEGSMVVDWWAASASVGIFGVNVKYAI